MLEVASESNGQQDESRKRIGYEACRVQEYWRFDPSGGEYHQQHLAGDRLVDGVYQPITIHGTADTHYWGRRAALNMSLCWENGQLRWWDPAAERYLPTQDEQAEALIATRQALTEEREARSTAEDRVQELEAGLKRRQLP